MDLSYTPEEEAFRAEVRAWLDTNLPAEWRNLGGEEVTEDHDRAIQREWQRRLYDGGWITLAWPKEQGGRGASPVMVSIYQEELAKAGAPGIIGTLGVTMLAPLLSVYGSEWQKQTYLHPILRGEIVFAQGFSEPDAGSDLAALKCRAELRDGRWIINGQKTWSSGAHFSDRSFLLARTDPDAPAHKGIGMFLIDLHQPGIEIRPIRQMTGSGEFCEIFLTDAEVDPRDVVGSPTDGWMLAMATFGFERGGLANAYRFQKAVAGLADLARQTGQAADELVRQRVAQAWIEAHILRVTGLRNLTRAQQGKVPGPEASLTKLYWSEMDKRIQETAIALQGMYGALDPHSPQAIDGGRWQYSWMWAQAETIYAGSSEIQRNIIAERVLGLPRSR